MSINQTSNFTPKAYHVYLVCIKTFKTNLMRKTMTRDRQTSSGRISSCL